MRHSFSVAGLFVALACSGLSAQTMDVRASVPFPFRAGAGVMPAGDYTIHHSNGVLRIQEADGNHAAALLLTNAVTRSNRLPNARLEFHRYGENYFLAAVWTPDSPDGCALPITRSEKEIAGRLGLPEPVSVALGRR